MQIADRMKMLGTETAFEVLAKARALEAQGKSIIHLEIGEPDFDTPGNVKAAGIDAIQRNFTHYGPSAGLPDVRKAIAEYSGKVRGMEFSPEEVVVVPGGKPVMFYAIMAIMNPGDEIIYPNPGFPIYESMINFMGGKAVPIHIREEREFSLDVGELRKLVTDKTRMIIINSPANPTGGILERADLEGIAEIAIKHDLWVLSDEIYQQIIYGKQHLSIATLPGMKERTIILDGFSKAYAMTGWRLGYGVMNKSIAPHITRLMTNSNSCTATFTQMAGAAALRGPQDSVRKMTEEFRRRRDLIVGGLNKIPGFSCKMPHGAFYVFPNIKKSGKTSQQMSDYLLNEGGVACLPGTSFGALGEGYLRFSYANSEENIREALKRIDAAVRKLK
ncbi:MAG TPA: pyridoxal phosphate-dependent aminotransferase [Candidatus Norongarragalinales archaeon]|nr:pyridoxal phosphate-dependent aminotransferase [Candidatus Norongarragalinales archaeon]